MMDLDDAVLADSWADRLRKVQPLILQFGLARSMQAFPTEIERGLFGGAHGWIEFDDEEPIACVCLTHPQILHEARSQQFRRWLMILSQMTGIDRVEVQCKTQHRDYLRMAMLGEFGDWEWFDRIPENVDAWEYW